MEDVLINGTAGGLGIYGHPSAGKTGTTDSSSNVWFDGFTPQLSTAVWMADYTAPNTNPLTNVCLPSGCFAEVFGATIPAPMWHQFMTFAESGLPYAALPPPASEYAVASGNGIPNIAGMSPSAALAALQQVGLTGQVSGTAVDSTEPAGTVASTSPAIGSQAPGNGVIIIYLSNGHAPPPSPSPTTQPSASPSGHPTTSPSPTKTK
jgi:membrane peptidoglycan carboxypeptidase